MQPPNLVPLVSSHSPEPKPMEKQSSSESSGVDSIVADLNNNEFSIQITSAKVVTPEPAAGYFSYYSPMS